MYQTTAAKKAGKYKVALIKGSKQNMYGIQRRV